VALLALIGAWLIRRIKRHASSEEECFLVALLLGIGAYWLPSVVFLILPAWAYLFYKNIFSLRSFLASLIGFATVAIWLAVLSQLSIINYQLSIAHNVRAWIPTGAVLLAWLGTTIVRQTLRVR